jgi:hypothetical protein
MRANGVRSLFRVVLNCHHEAVLSADRWPDDVLVLTEFRSDLLHPGANSP